MHFLEDIEKRYLFHFFESHANQIKIDFASESPSVNIELVCHFYLKKDYPTILISTFFHWQADHASLSIQT